MQSRSTLLFEGDYMTKFVNVGDDCVGCGTCAELCPSLFYFYEDKMKASVLDAHSITCSQCI